MSYESPYARPPKSGVTLAFAIFGGIALLVIAGVGVGLIVLSLNSSSQNPNTTAQTSVPSQGDPPQPSSTPTITVTAPPQWQEGFWSPGSPCLIPYPGTELGLEYGYTDDVAIKSWVYGVQELIDRLWQRGLSPSSPGPIDGEYGAKTEAGVLGFQQRYQIPAVGRVGATTWATLRNECERFR